MSCCFWIFSDEWYTKDTIAFVEHDGFSFYIISIGLLL
jgi:protein associated with RNAse G/E